MDFQSFKRFGPWKTIHMSLWQCRKLPGLASIAVGGPWAQVKVEEALRGSISVREGHSGGLEVVGKHEMLENYLWVVSVGIGDDRKWGRGGAVDEAVL